MNSSIVIAHGALDGLRQLDEYTANHSKQVGELSYNVAIGQMMGLSSHECTGVLVAGYLHDIGKLLIPLDLLTKPGALTNEERDIVKRHTIHGYNLIRDIEWPWPIAEVALQHHERLDGSGYPAGLKGDEICMFARIVAVTDLIDAMVADRSYRPARGWDAAKQELLNGRGILFDADVVDAAIELMNQTNPT